MEALRIRVGDLVFDARAAGPEEGPLVLLLHGFPQTSHEWRAQLPVLAELGLRAVAPDQRGYSPDARPASVEAYAMERLVGDVTGMAEALGGESFHLVGHDWGAAVAWFTALANPERVISLLCVSTPHPLAFREALRSPTGRQARMSGYMEVLRSEAAEDLLLAGDAAGLRAVFREAGFEREEVEVYVEALGTREALGGALAWYRANREAPDLPLEAVRGVPTTFVWSTEDRYLGREGAELTARYVEGEYRFVALDGVSHWVPERAAERLNRILREHFGEWADGAG